MAGNVKSAGTKSSGSSSSKPDDPEQSKRFIEAAKEAEADETEKGAEKAFRKVVPTSRPNSMAKKDREGSS